ncbi:MAG: EAL domain-containing protein [Pseudomonadota bacterium]|nr:EAL domain-containing protein [Pseudomonadota bacterium]
MGRELMLRVRRLLDIGEADTAFGRALLHVRYGALQRQIPLLYVIALANFIGLHLATGGAFNQLWHPVNLLIVIVVLRLAHWLRTRSQSLPPEQILKELHKTWLFAALISLSFSAWAIRLFAVAPAGDQEHVILFASLAAIGCAYGLSSFPSAARLPLILFALPLAATLILTGAAAHVAVGVSLTLITLLLLRLLGVHNKGITQLVRSRSEIEAERERALKAETIAIAEKARVKQVADTDPLTSLANRRAFLVVLEQAVARPERCTRLTLALVDLDGFKPINDTFGHAMGDAVLTEVAARLKKVAGAEGLAARMGGDEFALLVPGCTTPGEATRLGRRIVEELRRAYAVESRQFRLSGCCGLHLVPPEERDLTLALGRCDSALYAAKQRGRGAHALFTPDMEQARRRRTAIERALRDPGLHEQIGLVFQPIYELGTMQLKSFEALARWDHPELGPVSPSEFIPITEQINAVEAIGSALLRRGAEQAGRWPEAVSLSFNLSALQLCSATSAGRILETVDAAGLDPGRLQLEVTETALLVDFESARGNLRLLREAGVRIVLDDFGAGYASISYLREIDFDAIKLDGSLIVAAPRSPPAMRLLRGVVELCASLGVPCVAEHIEEEVQLALLRQLNCRYGQGYLLSPPVDAEAAEALARARLLTLPLAEAEPPTPRAAA